MLDAIFETLQTIGNFIASIVDFVVGLFEDIAYFITLLAEIPSMISSFFSFFPPAVLAVVLSGISLIVVLRVIGRSD